MSSKLLLYFAIVSFILFGCKKETNDNNSTTIDFSGTWIGTWTSTSYNLSGTFVVNISQQQGTLSGTISIPSIGMQNAELKGTVKGINISFGDIENTISFSGVLNKDSSSSGNYTYPGQSDKGTWKANKSGINSILYPSDTITTELNSIFLNGVASDGTNFYTVYGKKMYKLNTNGKILDSLVTPVGYPCGLTSNGTTLYLADDAWGTKMIYRLNGLETIALKSPGSGNFDGMDIIGQDLWIMDNFYGYNTIYKLSLQTGIVSDSIPLSTDFNNFLAVDEESLWYKSFGKIIKMDLQGNILREFEYPWSAPSGLAFSQNSLWIADILDKKIYKTDTGFNLLATININIDNPSDLTFQGSDIWILGYENPSGTLLKIDKAYKINTSGSLLNTIELPGNINEGAGLAFGNNLLWFANSKAKLIYKIDLSGNTCFSYPNTFQFLAYDGTNFWSFDKQNGNLSKFSQTGELLNSFSLVDQSVTGMTWDGNYLWLLSDNSIESIMKLKKLDASGNIIKTIEVYRPAVVVYHSYGILTYGIVFNNNAFWIFGKGPFGDPMKIYKYSI